jgi:hypothetical protein
MGTVTPETCRVTLQQINICTLLHLVGFLLTLILKHSTIICEFPVINMMSYNNVNNSCTLFHFYIFYDRAVSLALWLYSAVTGVLTPQTPLHIQRQWLT